MDLAKILKDAGADKPKQTRPQHAKWCNNTIQVRLPYGRWAFYNAFPQFLTGGAEVWGVDEYDFPGGRSQIDTLRALYPDQVFRLVAIVEVS